MCQSNCQFQDYEGDCTREDNKGICPLYIEEQKLKFWEDFYNNTKCKDCMFTKQCDYLTDNCKDDFCQTIHTLLEERL